MQLAHKTFKSRKEATQYIKNILNKSELFEAITGEDFRILKALINRHPQAKQKIGCGIKHIFKGPSLYDTTCFFIVRKDDTTTDFSYLTALKGKEKPLLQQFAQACRSAVREDLMDAKWDAYIQNEFKLKCEISNKTLGIQDAHLDHKSPYTFQVIVDTFIAANDIHIQKSMLSVPADNQLETTFKDKALREKFRQFHHKVADLRILCKEEHMKLPKETKSKRPVKIPA